MDSQKPKDKIILIVEDDLIVAEMESMILQDYGYNVVTVNSGEKAVKIIKTELVVDLILMDIDLGEGLDGTEYAEQILKIRDIPIVFLSSHTEPEIVERTEKITSYGYVVKGSGITVLEASIKMAFKLFDAKVEAKKREEELLFHSLILDQIEDRVIVTDFEGNIQYINKANLKSLGYTKDELINKPIEILGAENSQGITQSEILEETKKTGHWSGEVVNYTAEGNKIILESKTQVVYNREGKRIALCGVSTDITERYKFQKEIAESEQKFRHLFNSSRDGFVIVDSKGCFINANKSYCDMLGYTLEELKEKNDFYAITPEKWHNWERDNIVKEKLLKIGYSGIYEKEYIKKDGTIFPVELQGYSFFDENKKVKYLWGVVRDITTRKAEEEKISSLLEEKEILLQEIQHRTKNQFYLIESIFRLEALYANDDISLKILNNAADRVSGLSLIYDKLYLNNTIQEINIKNYLNELICDFKNIFNVHNKLKIEVNIDDIVLDSKKVSTLGIIINELFTNSIKYAFKGEDSFCINISLIKENNNNITFIYHDNGYGLPDKTVLAKSSSFGYKLIKLLTKQLSGKLNIENKAGTKIIIKFGSVLK